MKILVVQGAGMNMRGKTQTEIFGTMTLDQYNQHITQYAAELDIEVEIFHSNVEGEVINRLYAANDQGLLTVLDAATGEEVYAERVNMRGSTYPSISVAGNRLYVSSDTGATVVVQTGREYKELARNQLEPFRSSLVFDGKRVYVRTAKNLFCIGE